MAEPNAADHQTPSAADNAHGDDDHLLSLLHEHLADPACNDIADLLGAHPQQSERLLALYADYQLAARIVRDQHAPDGHAAASETTRPIAGRFTPVGELGRGGMSIVLAAWDGRMRRKVALKCLRMSGAVAAPDVTRLRRRRARLINEAQVLAQLDHPGIVPVYDVVQDERTGEVFVAMLRVRGVDLRQVYTWTWAHEQGWNLARVVNVLQRVCEAVAYAHGKGVLHRDLKPANVMIGAFGEAYVMDWGLARSGADQPAGDRADHSAITSSGTVVVTDRDDASATGSSSVLYTQEGDVLGTPSYMAPEQASGLVHSSDTRADVYSVGAMLYELLAGHAPYVQPNKEQSSTQMLDQVRAKAPAPLVARAKTAPAELVAIAEKAMARNPQARYGSMRELADDLRAFLEGRVVLAHRHGALVELSKWVRRNKGAAAAMVACVGFLVAMLVTQSLHTEELVTVNLELKARDYRNRVALAATALQGGDLGEARALLTGAAEDLRGWEWRYLWGELDTSFQTFSDHGPRVIGLAISPDGARLACGDDARKVTLWDLPTGMQLAVSQPLAGAVYGLTFAPDGRQIFASTSKPSVESLHALTLEVERPSQFARVADVHGHRIAHDVIVSRDGNHLFTASQLNRVVVWERATGRLLDEWLGHKDPVSFLLLSRAGDRLASASGDGTARVWEVPGGKVIGVVGRQEARVDGVAFTPDGQQLVTGDWRGRIDLWDIVTGRHEREIATLPMPIYRMAWSPDDSVVAVAAGPFVYLFRPSDWKLLDRLAGFEQIVNNVVFSPDGNLLAAADQGGVAKTWLKSGIEHRWPRHANEGGVRDVLADSASGLCVVVRHWGHVELWDHKCGRLERQFRIVASVDDADVAPDGRWLTITDMGGSAELHDLETGTRLARYQMLGIPIREAAACRRQGRVFLGHADATVQAHAVGSTQPLWRSQSVVSGGLTDMQIAADGSMLVLGTDTGGLVVIETETGATRGWQVSTQRVSGATFSADRRAVLVVRHEGNVALFASDTGRELWRVPAVIRGGTCGFSPDGSRVFVGSSNGDLRVVDARNGQRIAALSRDRLGIGRLRVSPDGQTVVTASLDDAIRFWSVSAPRR